MEKIKTQRNKIVLITEYIKELSEKEQDVLLEELKRNSLIAHAQKLKKSVKKNNLTMAQIVAEVRKVREAIHAKK